MKTQEQNSGLLVPGISKMANMLTRESKRHRRLFVLNYHRVLGVPDPLLDSEPHVEEFRWQMALLARHFNVLPLSDAIDAMKANRLPPLAVAITFDDGYRSVHDFALPILKSFGLPATVFVTTGVIDKSSMWSDRVIESIRHMPGKILDLSDIGLGTHSLSNIANRKEAVNNVKEQIKYLPPILRNSAVLHLEALSNHTSPHGLMLTREMIVSLSKNNIEIGAHTVTHPILSRLSDEEAFEEIRSGKQLLESITGKPVRLFAYPNGKRGQDFNERHVAMIKDLGFSAAFTTSVRAASSADDYYQIPRGRPWDRTPLLFATRLLCWLLMAPK